MSTQTIDHHPHVTALEVDPHARLSAALVLSLLLWAPFGVAAVQGNLDVFDAGIRYLVAFLGCRLAVGGIAHLAATYRHLHVTAQRSDAGGEVEVEVPDQTYAGRRASDS